MAKKGSVTLFLALVLSLILSLFSASLESAKMAVARTQILNSVDIGLYSLFGQYEKTLLKDYDLFFLDGSCGGGTLKLASVYDNMEAYITPVLKQNGQKLTLERGGFSGYRLATDENGEVFYQQVIRYMKDTLGSHGVQLLLDKINGTKQKIENAEEEGKKLEEGNALESYETEMNSAEQNSQAALEEAQQSAENEQVSGDTFTSGPPAVQVENPIPVIKEVRKMGILDLVIPSGKSVSSGSITASSLVSGRTLQKGMELAEKIDSDDSYTSQLLFQQYLTDKLGDFLEPSDSALKYQMEYLLFGKTDDASNLKEMAGKLLLIREGINLAHLLSDGGKRAQVQALATAVASAFWVPPASVIIEAALILCWSFAESILDVRELFAGGKVSLVKNASNWQLSLGNLSNLLGVMDSERESSEDGMTYEEYLNVFLMTQSKEKKLKRGMDMIEMSIRTKTGNESFLLDSCIESIEASLTVTANKKKTFQVTKLYSYDQA